MVLGDREDMLELLGNLLDNACKWGRRRVMLLLEQGTDGVLISVEDDGPGCPPEALSASPTEGSESMNRPSGMGWDLPL
ncbi:MAG: ATP-binding protein [Candidatus Manganitrophus sp.]|nr:MAG: ATP-binding protein [Candidatus Manganitrophus sp.]